MGLVCLFLVICTANLASSSRLARRFTEGREQRKLEHEQPTDEVDLSPTEAGLPRTRSAGGLPVYHGADIEVVERSGGPTEEQWFGSITFDVSGQRWRLDGFLNHGAEGQTYTIIHVATGNKYAAKFCDQPDSAEVDLVQKLPRGLLVHPNFVHYELVIINVHSIFAPAHHIIIMEHVPNGELFDVLASQEPSVAGKPLSEGTSRRLLHDIISGVAECYRFGVTHRDLKPENLLLHGDGRIIIIDMGHAKHFKLTKSGSPLPRTTTSNMHGTPAFMAPEVWSGSSYDCEPADVWSLGVIAFYLHAKLPAFSLDWEPPGGGVASWRDVAGPDNTPLWRKLEISGVYPMFPHGLKHFINTLWRIDPRKRPSFEELALAVAGDDTTIATYPGLAWLAEPVNDAEAFIGELQRSCPDKNFTLPQPRIPAQKIMAAAGP